MAKKKPEGEVPEKRADMTVERQKGESDDKALARLAGSATFRAAVTERQIIGTAMGGNELGLFDINAALTERFLEVTRDGDMAKTEAMLLAQAHTCEAIFHEFARRSLRSDSMPRLEAYMRMALKAQQQSASTLRVLGELKSPKSVAFIKQQNNAAGHQQVNNGVAPQPATRAHEEKPIESNELLEHHHGKWLDAAAASAAAGSDKAMETVGAVHRAGD
ncbi:hypothetical protein PQR75_46890 [Paraburkholderia fungorum]|uniref:hypothetical protein n=1 Tax=Paraburkholderia fungorum TaxID=134537 RepID=UPI0038BE0512